MKLEEESSNLRRALSPPLELKLVSFTKVWLFSI